MSDLLQNLNSNGNSEVNNNPENEKLNDHFSEIMNLNLNDFCGKTARLGSNEMSDYFSSPSKSSIHDYSSPESSKISSGTNYLIKDSNNNSLIEESDNEADKHITKLFVGNLPTSTTLPELLAVFKKFGPVNEALSVVKDHNYAFIHFYNRKDAEVALKEVNDSLFKDRYIRVQFSTSQGFTNNKNKGLDKKRYFMNSSFAINSTTKQYVYPNQTLPTSYSTSFLSNGFSNSMNNNLFMNKSTRPITANRFPNSQTTFFDKNQSRQMNNSNSNNNLFTNQSNLLIEASKLQNINKLNSYNMYHDELQQKQQLIQALYLRQQQQLLQQQIQQQLQIQFQNQDNLQQQLQNRIPKSNTIGNFNFNYNSNGSLSNLNNSLSNTEQVSRLLPSLGHSRRDNATNDQFLPSKNLNNL